MLTPLQQLLVMAISSGADIDDIIPELPIRTGNKSLPESEQQKLIAMAEQKRQRKAEKRAAIKAATEV